MEYTNAKKNNVKKGKPTGLTNGTEKGNAEAHPKETWEQMVPMSAQRRRKMEEEEEEEDEMEHLEYVLRKMRQRLGDCENEPQYKVIFSRWYALRRKVDDRWLDRRTGPLPLPLPSPTTEEE